jgi:hypothetical protein
VNDPAAPGADRSALVEGVDVDAIVVALSKVPGVRGVGTAQPGAAATYLPGRRVQGVRVEDDRITVEVCVAWDTSAAKLEASAHKALKRLTADRAVHLVITDIEPPGRAAMAGSADPSPSAPPESE